jgi:hypothetical protein
MSLSLSVQIPESLRQALELAGYSADLIASQWLELLETLEQVHTKVLIPERVWREFAEGASEEELATVAKIGAIQQAQVSDINRRAKVCKCVGFESLLTPLIKGGEGRVRGI